MGIFTIGGKIMSKEEPSDYDRALGFLQALDVWLNINQTSNDVLFSELQKQNKEYLEKILAQVTNFPGQFKFRQECIEQEQKKIIEQNNVIIKQNEEILEIQRAMASLLEEIGLTMARNKFLR